MAAGASSRFGANKLSALINGKPMIEYAFDAVPAEKLGMVFTVTGYDEVETLAASYGFRCIRNHHPELGLSHTIRLGTEALSKQCSAILYMVADQPLLKRKSVAGLIDLYLEHPDNIVSAASRGRRGNPCIFPQKYFSSLMSLKGDVGGSTVIKSAPESLLLYEIPGEELLDADTPEVLDRLRNCS